MRREGSGTLANYARFFKAFTGFPVKALEPVKDYIHRQHVVFFLHIFLRRLLRHTQFSNAFTGNTVKAFEQLSIGQCSRPLLSHIQRVGLAP